MTISFCLPKEHWPNQSWIDAWERNQILPLEEKGKGATSQCWIYQTWALLIQSKVACQLLEGIPSQGGIIIAMSPSFHSISSHVHAAAKKNSLETFFKTKRPRCFCAVPRNFFFVDIVADGLPHPAAHLHLVQNRAHAARLPRALFMPHWAQPHLIPRDQARGALFQNISFFGDINNLAPELRSPSWRERLHKELGLHLDIRSAERWHDYSDVDAVIAIRDFSHSPHFHKPATKLYNAWQAGVPFIGGRDSAYAADGRAGKDYLVATSPEEVFRYLKQLKQDHAFRARLVASGFESGKAYTREATLERWKKLFQTTLPEHARQWQAASAFKRTLFFPMQQLFCLCDRLLN